MSMAMIERGNMAAYFGVLFFSVFLPKKHSNSTHSLLLPLPIPHTPPLFHDEVLFSYEIIVLFRQKNIAK